MAKITVLAKNGQPLGVHHRTKLSSLAWFAGRISTAELRSCLDAIGVSDPLNSTWSLELPNGVTVAAIEIEDDGGAPAVRQTKVADKTSAADRITTLNAHKRASKAAKAAGTDPIPDEVLAKMTPAEADKVAEARTTRKAPPVAAAS